MANDTSGSSGGSNPLAGLLTDSSGRTDMTWNNLTSHEKNVAWGQINDVYMQILGRQATVAEARQGYNSGISNYALGQQLMMSKEFTHTSVFHQLKRGYTYELQQFVGSNFKLKNQLAQSFAAHNYTTTDIQAWVYSHPHVYVHSNDYLTRVAQMKDVYQSVFGIDPYAAGNGGTHPVDTNARKPGIQGHQVAPNDPLLAHIQKAALHFQTPDQYRAWLMRSPMYKAQALSKVQPTQAADASLTLNAQGRPVQQGMSGIGHQQQADVAQ